MEQQKCCSSLSKEIIKIADEKKGELHFPQPEAVPLSKLSCLHPSNPTIHSSSSFNIFSTPHPHNILPHLKIAEDIIDCGLHH